MPTQALIGGRYSLVREVAQGGMAAVWEARAHGAADVTFPVAIKIMRPDFQIDDAYVAMFVEEVRIGATLHHPHLIDVLDYFQHEGADYIVMEWIDGVSLLQLLVHHADRKSRLSWPATVHIAIGVLRGLGAAHRRTLPDGTLAPVIHRDVSPGNILIDWHGAVKLADFGVARARDRVAKLTAPNIVKGKLSYLAPELARGGIATPRSDLFSLAVTLWEALAGKKLFSGSSNTDVLLSIMRGDIPALEALRPELPGKLCELVHRTLAAEPTQRPASAREMIDDLNEILRYDGPATDAFDEIADAVWPLKTPERQEVIPVDSAEMLEEATR